MRDFIWGGGEDGDTWQHLEPLSLWGAKGKAGVQGTHCWCVWSESCGSNWKLFGGTLLLYMWKLSLLVELGLVG